jgi:hypothetical protein
MPWDVTLRYHRNSLPWSAIKPAAVSGSAQGLAAVTIRIPELVCPIHGFFRILRKFYQEVNLFFRHGGNNAQLPFL